MKPWMFMILGISLIAGAFLYGKSIGKDLKENEIREVQQEAAEIARADERRKQEKINEGYQRQNEKLSTINATLTSDIKRLQHRESRRLSEASRPECKGANGLELAREYAGFLVEYSAQAAKQDAAIAACYHYADSLQD